MLLLGFLTTWPCIGSFPSKSRNNATGHRQAHFQFLSWTFFVILTVLAHSLEQVGRLEFIGYE